MKYGNILVDKKNKATKKNYGGNKMNKYYSARAIIRRKLINDMKISYIRKELENIQLVLINNWDTFGWINTDNISKLLNITLQRGVSNTKITEDIRNTINEIHDRNSFCSCLRQR